MARKPESVLRGRIVAALRARGAWARVIHSGPESAGLPDVAAVHHGRALWLEVKTPQNEKGTTKLQERELVAIRAAGGVAAEVRSVEDALYCLEIASGRVPRRGPAGHPVPGGEKATAGVTGRRGRLQDNPPVNGEEEPL